MSASSSPVPPIPDDMKPEPTDDVQATIDGVAAAQDQAAADAAAADDEADQPVED